MRAETIGRRQDGSRFDGVNSGDRIVARATLLAFLRFRKGFDSLAILIPSWQRARANTFRSGKSRHRRKGNGLDWFMEADPRH